MADHQRKTFSRLIGAFAVVATTLLPVRRADCADAGSVIPEKGKTGRVVLALDDDGNVMLRYGRVSLTLVYGPTRIAEEEKERQGLIPPLKESPGMGEMSFKVGFAF
jgi:hypothetical protein